MGRDTIQLETAVSTISQEYMLEFTSEYGISEDLHPELPGPEERIVDFSEDMDLFNLTNAPNPSKVKTGLRSRAAHEVLLLTPTASRVIDMEDPNVATESSGTPFAIEKSLLDFDNENPSPPMTEGKGTEDQFHETVAPEIPSPFRKYACHGSCVRSKPRGEGCCYGTPLSKKHRRRSTREWKSLPTMGLAAGSTFVTPADTKGVSDPDPLSYAEPQPHPEQSMTQVGEIDLLLIHGWVTRRYLSARMGSDQQLPPGHPERMPRCCRSHSAAEVDMGSQLRLRFEQEVRLLKKARVQIARRDQRIQVREEEIQKLDQEVQGLQNQTSNLKTLLEAEADMKKVVEAKNADLTKKLESLRTQFLDLQEFKKYEDDRVEKCCAEIDARLDALSIDFDEELYPHMLTAIAGRRWVIGHGMRLAAGRGLEVVKAYDPEANSKYLKALQDLKYPIVDLLEGLKDAPIEAVKEEMLLEETIAANVSRAEKKKRCRVVCRTRGVGFAHHARSDDVPVSVPTVAPQCLTILLAEAATQTKTSKDDASLRLLRSKSLLPMYNLDWL
nr:hypothetical protein [Tanacetum cinerariifolium]